MFKAIPIGLVVALITSLASGQTIQPAKKNKNTCSAIQTAINALPAEGGQVVIKAGTYTCADPIVIDRDRVYLSGEGKGTVLRLADGANAPVIVVGQTIPIPTATVHDVRISDLTIDGNRANQTFECFKGECTGDNPLRNNGITIRTAENVQIERVTVFGARSGGLVSELTCRHLTVRDFESYNNEFDGLAGYETERSFYSGLYLHDNQAAGLSFDLAFNNNILDDTYIANTGSVGIFMRFSTGNVFHGLHIEGSGDHGIFLAQVDVDSSKPASGNTFNGVVITGSRGVGIRVNDASCINNVLLGGQLVNNSAGCIGEATPGLLTNVGAICH